MVRGCWVSAGRRKVFQKAQLKVGKAIAHSEHGQGGAYIAGYSLSATFRRLLHD